MIQAHSARTILRKASPGRFWKKSAPGTPENATRRKYPAIGVPCCMRKIPANALLPPMKPPKAENRPLTTRQGMRLNPHILPFPVRQRPIERMAPQPGAHGRGRSQSQQKRANWEGRASAGFLCPASSMTAERSSSGNGGSSSSSMAAGNIPQHAGQCPQGPDRSRKPK